MKTRIVRPVLRFLALPLLAASAFGQTTGVSHPATEDDTVTTVVQTESDHYVKPVHGRTTATPTAVEVQTETTVTTPPASYPATATSYPATATSIPANATSIPAPAAPAEEPPPPALIERRPLPPASISGSPGSRSSGSASSPGYGSTGSADRSHEESREIADGDSGIVLAVPEHPHELRAGSILKVRLEQTIATDETRVGARFSAQLLTPAGHSGEVLLPVGSTVFGRVTKLHGGKRITGAAAIRLQPETVNLPDGTTYRLEATVAGLEGYTDSHVNSEGTILAKTHPGVDAAALGLATGAAAVTGAVVGGGVGAVVGASIGAGVGTYLWLNRDHQETLPAGTSLLLSLDEPLHVNPR